MGRSWKDDDWHDVDEMWEEEQRKAKRSKRVVHEEDEPETFAQLGARTFNERR